MSYWQEFYLQKWPLLEKYLQLYQIFWNEVGSMQVHLYISSQVSLMSENVTLKIMDIQPNWGFRMGTLPGYTLLPSLKICSIHWVL